ncbi:hypothetical protein D5S19_07670 [Amycolatopsis panacis]|uniref:Uncharacterized protein n=1 Tax=Amycolatopsis panacis TaxID=2340917 RepID=A0A419I7Y6_9PSEU|nr:hypothetical protein D5S19_07670 [Amycolatopsis panacis]
MHGGEPTGLEAESGQQHVRLDHPFYRGGHLDAVIEVPALRFDPDDVGLLARHFAHRVRGREVGFTPAAARALTASTGRRTCRVVREAAARSEVIDVPHLPAEVFTNAGHGSAAAGDGTRRDRALPRPARHRGRAGHGARDDLPQDDAVRHQDAAAAFLTGQWCVPLWCPPDVLLCPLVTAK